MKSGLLLIAALASSSCITLHTLDRTSTDRIGTVAVVGFSGVMRLAPSDDERRLAGEDAFRDVMTGLDVWLSQPDRFKRIGARLHTTLTSTLERELAWHPPRDTGASGTLAQALQAHPREGVFATWQLRSDGVLMADDALALPQSERDAIIRELGVDALAVASVEFVRETNSSIDHPMIFATVTMQLFAPGKAEPVWFDRLAFSDATGPVNLLAWQSADDEKVALAFDSALRSLIARYRQPPGK